MMAERVFEGFDSAGRRTFWRIAGTRVLEWETRGVEDLGNVRTSWRVFDVIDVEGFVREFLLRTSRATEVREEPAYVATIIGNGGLWHAGIPLRPGSGGARAICGSGIGEIDHRFAGDPLPATLETEPLGYSFEWTQAVECIKCRRIIERQAEEGAR
jgi:hypothetical protein